MITMKKPGIVFLALLQLVLFCPLSRGSGSQSQSYAIPTFVLSGGGSISGSASFKVSGTSGQSTPLMDPHAPPLSTDYDLYPGFWYTLEGGLVSCEDIGSFASAYGTLSGDSFYNAGCDLDKDGDVDGVDLAGF